MYNLRKNSYSFLFVISFLPFLYYAGLYAKYISQSETVAANKWDKVGQFFVS